jgi:hypothetical protein
MADDPDSRTVSDVARSILADSTPTYRPVVEMRVSCGHRLMMFIDSPEGRPVNCPVCGKHVRVQRNPRGA